VSKFWVEAKQCLFNKKKRTLEAKKNKIEIEVSLAHQPFDFPDRLQAHLLEITEINVIN
jgi:hypothetical protein